MARIPDSRREFDRMMARHKLDIERARREIDHVRRQLNERVAHLRGRLQDAAEEFDRAIKRGDAPPDAALRYRDVWGTWPEPERRKRRPPPPPRPWRGLEGGEPVPVEPQPKPKPLIDGAEAPID